MALDDTVCTLVPYFLVQEDQLDAFRQLGERMVERTRDEEGVLFYGFSFDGRTAHCREGYRDGAAILAHLDNVSDLLGQALQIASLERLEVHAPAGEIEVLKGPLSELDPTWFTMETGFRR